MTKQDIIDYVVTTPHNPNKAVLSTMLDSFEVGDNKQEIELSATENKVYTPEEGKVFNKVIVNVPEIQLDTLLDTITLTENGTTNAQEGRGFKTINVNVPFPTAEVIIENNEALYTYTLYAPIVDSNAVIVDEVADGGTFIIPLYEGKAILDGTDYSGVPTITGNCVYENYHFVITGDCTIVLA